MIEKEIEILKTGDYVCYVTGINKGFHTEDSIVREPKKVTSVDYKGVCVSEGAYKGRHFVVFHHESYFGVGSNESASCYAGEEYCIVPNRLK